MVEVLDHLELTGLVTTISGLSAIGAAAILRNRDLTRFDSPRAVVKHAGLCPVRTPATPCRVESASPVEGAPGYARAHGEPSGSPSEQPRHQDLTTRRENPLTTGQTHHTRRGGSCAGCR
jgi:transposase